MAFLIIIIGLGVQWYLSLYSRPYQYDWFGPYFSWMQEKLPIITTGHGLAGLLLLVLPLVLGVSIIFSLVYHLLGTFGYFVLSAALFWYCLDVGDLRNRAVVLTDEQLVYVYRWLFGVLFWFFVFGPVGLTLYVTVSSFKNKLTNSDELGKDVLRYCVLAEGVLDWIPVRLLGFSFALVGHFSTVFKSWSHYLLSPVQSETAVLSTWMTEALEGAVDSTNTIVLQRSLLVWLVVMALFSLGGVI